MKNKNDYYMPAEWEKHKRTFMEWPVKDSLVWPENYKSICLVYAEIAKAISDFENVTMIVNEDTIDEAKDLCGKKVEYISIPHNDAWCRDNGPTFLINSENKLRAINWRFNAWGEKYSPYDLDNEMAPKLLKSLKVDSMDIPIILEGGSIHVDGEGTLLTTKECLLNKNRNKNLDQEDIENLLKILLKVKTIIWFDNGLYGDETDGHIDNVACFVKPGTVLIQSCYDKKDPNYDIFIKNKSILENSKDAMGRTLEIIEIPAPPRRFYKGEQLTLSYLNFYFVNGGIILPVFGEDAKESDVRAIEILKNIFPDRKIAPINTIDLITEGGNIHCITQQMPDGIN